MRQYLTHLALILFVSFCIDSHWAIAQSVNLEALHLPYDGFCETVAQALKNYPPSTPDAAEANKRWWNGAMAAGGIPPYNIEYDHYRIIDEFFDACRPSPHTPIKPIMRNIGLQHRWILN